MSKSKRDFKWKGSKGDKPTSVVGAFLRGLLVLVVLGVLGLVAFASYIYIGMQPSDKKSKELVEIDIPIGTSVHGIASILEDHELIRNDLIFYYYTRFRSENDFQAGTYFMEKGLEHDTIIERLKSGKVYVDSQKAVIPEGLKITEMAELLEEKGLVDKERFLKVANETNFTDISFMSEIPESVPARENRLEGYLFPETYNIRESATEEDVVEMMLLQLEKELKDEWLTEMKRKGMTLNEVMTLASIIERETVSPEERKKVSGVYHNRLETGMKLQADATVQYALGEHTERVLYKDLEVDNPYNTYVYAGLPPGPIAVPGRASIEAAIFPDEHNFFYYVTKKDGTNEHYFSETYDEHKRNITKSNNN